MSKIQKTTDFNLFKRILGNRTKNQVQITKLINSFSESPELFKATPIIVNERMEVIDGQHRLEAAKALGQAIYYIVVEGLSLPEIQKLNSSTKTWTPVDYAISFSEKGNKHYQTYLDFKHKFRLTHEILVAYLAIVKGSTPITFRKGKFKVENVALSDKICGQFAEIREFHNKGDSKKFAFAVKELLLNPDYDHKKMMQKITSFGSKYFKEAGNTQDYMRQLELLYNRYSTGKEIRLF